MTKPFMRKTAALLAGSILLIGGATAQQAPAPDATKAPQPASGQASPKPKAAPSASTAQKAPAAKPGQKPAPKSAAPLPLTTPRQKASYAIGLNIGKGLQRDGVDIDSASLARGVKDAQSGAKPLLTDDEIKAVLTAVQDGLRKKQEAVVKALGDANQKEGDAFLAANKSKDGVVTLPSGLEYKILKEGTGPKPAATDSVVCNYRGTFLNGTEFDSSYKRGEPATFPVNQVIQGWTEALQLMPVGSKWELFVPSALAYGPAGGGPQSGIGPNAALIFEVELVSIKPKEDGKTPDKQ